jgi:hypothetical protein
MSSSVPIHAVRRIRPLRLLAALLLSDLVISVSNAALSMIGESVFSAPDDFCAFEVRNSMPVTLAALLLATVGWALLSVYSPRPAWWLYQALRIFVVTTAVLSLLLVTWQSLLGVVTLDLMVVVGASVTYLALTRLAPPALVRS